eukprot:CAMPEP_0119339534 /NCGR_PEP_ID=MMETSP1333-20130426/98444_1 /TAXON_ID=418940 /ORGANISM="Scyphosphaera apsteinii, Strain RCC1455" /LENGTH=165 /DNA_ID=CAMNT_0007351071 /DNA_START=149 /DNA_END=646 /DNA_ORIENTATION=-
MTACPKILSSVAARQVSNASVAKHHNAPATGKEDRKQVDEQLKNSPYAAMLEQHIVKRWLPLYPNGAKLRKLQREISFNMKDRQGLLGTQRKLPMDLLEPFVRDLEARGLLEIGNYERSPALKLMLPRTEAQKAAEQVRKAQVAEQRRKAELKRQRREMRDRQWY